jgi:hypothetical protein
LPYLRNLKQVGKVAGGGVKVKKKAEAGIKSGARPNENA